MPQKFFFTLIFLSAILIAPFAEAQEYMDLHYQFHKGDQFRITQHSSQETYLTLQSETDRTTNENNSTLQLTVQSIEADKATIEAEYTKIIIQSSSQDQEVSVNTETGQDDVFNRLFKGLIGKKFTLILKNDGTVTNVSGLDQIIDQMVNDLKGVKSKEKPTLKDFLKSQMGPEALKASLAIALPYYPPQKVHNDDSWMNQLYTKGFYHARIDNYWKLDYGDRYVIKLSNQGKFNTDATEEVDLGGGQKGFVDLEGQIEGKYIIDPQTFWPTSCILHVELTGNYIYESQRKRKRDVKVPVRVVINTRYQFNHL